MTAERRKRRSWDAGLTLLELIVSLAVMAVLMGGLGSALLLAGRAVPRGQTRAEQAVQASEALAEISSELREATFLGERGERTVAFLVPDRNGDGVVERVRYAWSGTPGDPLTRSLNGSMPTTMLEGVRSFALDYRTRTATESYTGPVVERPEECLSEHLIEIGSLNEERIEYDRWVAQAIVPALPENALSWRITRARIEAVADGLVEDYARVQIRSRQSDGSPGSNVVADETLLETALAQEPAWVEVPFSNQPSLSPSAAVSLVLRHGGGGASMRTRFDNDGGGGFYHTSDGGYSWTAEETDTLRHALYGRVTVQNPPQRLIHHYVTDVTLRVEVGSGDSPVIETRLALLNRPEALATAWSADFSVNPTALDVNADGLGDWSVRSGSSLWIDSGVLGGSGRLDMSPDHPLDQPIVLETAFRSTSSDRTGAVWTYADWRGDGRCALIGIESTCRYVGGLLGLLGTYEQTLRIFYMTADGQKKVLVSYGGLSTRFLNVRLLIDPAHQTVNVAFDGSYVNTYVYDRYTPSNVRRGVVLVVDDGVEFDEVSIRVGGESS